MRWLNFFILSLLFFSCQKEQISFEMKQIEVGTTDNIYDLIFVNDSLAFLCGGRFWETGMVAKSIDGGESWEIILEADNVLYKVAFKNELEGVALGFSGRAWQTVDGGQTWNLTESTPNYPVFTDAVFLDNNKMILSAGYSYYYGGFASYFFNGQTFGDSLTNQDMESVYFFDSNEGLMAGYGVVYKTFNGGTNWEILSVDGDYFKDVEFNTDREGLLIGYRGKIFSSSDAGNHWEKVGKKASFFTTKGNLEDAALYERQAFICVQNSSFYYSANFLDGNWLSVDHNFNEDLLCVTLKNATEGFVTGENGLLVKFFY